jgi:Holliday junction resolvase RusA-like endonuclease
MDSLRLTLALPPSGNHRNGISDKGVHYRKKTTKDYFSSVYAIKLENRIKTITEPCRAMVIIRMTDKRRDADNVIKTLYDALQWAGIIEDDKLIKETHMFTDNESGKRQIDLLIEPLGEFRLKFMEGLLEP